MGSFRFRAGSVARSFEQHDLSCDLSCERRSTDHQQNTKTGYKKGGKRELAVSGDNAQKLPDNE